LNRKKIENSMGPWTYEVGLWWSFKGKKRSKIQWVLGLMK
jgi:hypothetical protein